MQSLLGQWIEEYENHLYRWAVIHRETGECIGQVAFCKNYTEHKTAEAEYCIGRSFWGKGYATEALRAVIEHTFRNTSYNKVEAFVRSENTKSVKVLIKSGMIQTDNVKRFELKNKLPIGKTCYFITKQNK